MSSPPAVAAAASHHTLLPVTNLKATTKRHCVARTASGSVLGDTGGGRKPPPILSSSSLSLCPIESPSSDPDAYLLASAFGSSDPRGLHGWSLERRHIHLLSGAACVVAISTAWLFFSAIPAILALRRAAESLEKLLDATAEELPDTMAAVRLSGMEISDLTLELSDLGQELTKGVRSSTRAVRLAEDRLRCLATMSSTVPMQGQASQSNDTEGPSLAKSVRNVREGVVKGRAVVGLVFNIARLSQRALRFFSSRKCKHTPNT